MRVLVTGATGFIGRHLVPRLVAAGHGVTALVRATSRTDGLSDLGVTLAKGDVTDRPSVQRALEGCDGVVHLAALVRLGRVEPGLIRAVNVEGTRNVLEAAGEAGVKRALHCSSIAAIGTTDGRVADETTPHGPFFKSEYERTKHQAGELAVGISDSGLPLVQALPSVVFGAGDPNFGVFFRLYAKGRLLRVPAPETVLSFVHVEELAEGMLRAFTKGKRGGRYIFTQGNLSLAELFETVAEGMGRPVPTRFLDTRTLRRLAKPVGWLAALTSYRDNVSGEPFHLAGRTMAYTSAKAQRELGWRPGDLTGCLRETARHYGEKYGRPAR